MKAIEQFRSRLDDNLAGQGGVAVSVCSAHPRVLRALFQTALEYDTFALIESTSNQVDQFGGYTGMKPPDFVRLVYGLAEEEGFPLDRILLGGDHLGVNARPSLTANKAQKEANALIAEYARAGYKKIHLDPTFISADAKDPPSEETIAARCVEMAKVCEAHSGDEPPVYIVGTEVPTPGGAYGDDAPRVTTPADVENTLSVFRDVFLRNNLEAVWSRVVGLVVQPGVEFGDKVVHPFQPVPELSAAILNHGGMVYEAHSTDYQTGEDLKRMARDHFCILKVGPWLTFALREGFYLLEMIEKELNPPAPSRFRETLVEAMMANPVHWKQYYRGSPREIEFKLNFSYSDRARYYLGNKKVLASQERLIQNVSLDPPESLISQFMPNQYSRVRSGRLSKDPWSLAMDRVRDVLELYMDAGR